MQVERILPWALRVVWIAVLVTGGAAIEGDVVAIAAFLGWVAGVMAMAIPATVSLTAVRIIVPLAPVAAVVAAFAGAETAAVAWFVASGAVATAIAFAADLGRVFVQASAYGEEDRHLLRPPVAYAMASFVTWTAWAALAVSSPVAFGDERWVIGALTAVGVVAGAALGWPRWHKLAQRWFVVVPVGVVIRDHLVLAETVMLRRQEIASIRLAPAGTVAADLTGPAAGHALEIATSEPVTAIFAATPKQPHGTAIHLSAALIAPSRPGRALHAAAERRLPVG